MYTTGVGGIVGDKGAMAVSFKFNHTSLCFVIPPQPSYFSINAN